MKSILNIAILTLLTTSLFAQKINLQFVKEKTAVSVNGNTLSFTAAIINTGGDASSYSYLGYYLSKDETFTTNDIYLGYDYVTSLNFKEESVETFNIDLTNFGIEEGTYYIGAILDYTNRVSEINEKDNVFDFRHKVPFETRPNLKMIQASIEMLDGKIEFDITVKNVSGIDAEYSYLGYYLSTDQNIDDNDIYLGYDYVTSLGAWEESIEYQSVTLSNWSDIPNGTYYVGAIVDYTDRVDEKRESDNKYVKEQAIFIQNRTDLIVKSGSYSVSKQTGIFAMSAEVKNNTNIDAPFSYLGFYLSKDEDISTDDHLLAEEYIDALSANNSSFVARLRKL